jgi:glycosyltransferase involved in cell wall biosynthesis
MRILHLIYDDPGNPYLGGGGAIRTDKINRILAKTNDITVISGAFPGCRREETKNGIRHLKIGTAGNYFLSRLTYALQARTYVRSIPHDILVEEFSGNSPTFAPWATDKPCIAVLQNHFGFQIIKKKLLLGVLPWLYERFAIRSFDAFIAVNKSLISKFIPGIPGSRYRVIPQGIEKKDLRIRPAADKFILFVGRLDFFQKGIDILLKSLRLIADLKVKLVIVGGGDKNRLLKMARKENVVSLLDYHPHLDHDKIMDMYRDAYCLALPSRYEGWPLVCLESFSQGKPVVGTDIPGLESVLQHRVNGLKTEKDDPVLFAAALRKIITDKKLRQRLGRSGRKFAAGFVWETLAKRQESFYRETVDHARKE